MREGLEGLVRALDEVPELERVLANRELDTAVKVDVLERVLAGENELVRNFAVLLARKGRAGEIREAASEFELLVAAAERVLAVELTTAHALSEQEFERIVSEIERRSGRAVAATRSVEPALIGGIVLRAGSRRVDASVRGRLERLAEEIGVGR